MSAESRDESDEAFVADLLLGTSRTFALAIPLLADERRRQIGLSYLLFRVADSIEDAPEGNAEEKKELLAALKNCFQASKPSGPNNVELSFSRAESFIGLWPEHSPNSQLLRGVPRLIGMFNGMPASISHAICRALTATISGMMSFIDCSIDSPNQIQIQTLADLRLYCYAVAGIVGEMLTDIFVDHHPAGSNGHDELRKLSVGFGEFLQLINVLKDSQDDASGGRVFIPVDVSRETVQRLALDGRRDAGLYIRTLEQYQFPRDIIHFCRFIYLLADGSLEKLCNGGAGSKLGREEVLRILSNVKSESVVLTYTDSASDPVSASKLML